MSRRRWRLAFGFLLVVHILVLGAPVFAPYDSDHQARHLPYAPPMKVHFDHPHNGWQWRPWVYPARPVPGTFDVYEDDVSRPTALRFWVVDDSGQRRWIAAENGVHIHFLGTDGLGRDLFSRLLFAGRVSLLTGLFAACLSVGLGVLLGATAGYFGGWFDRVSMRGGELLMALPWLYLLLAVRAFLPLEVDGSVALTMTLGLLACLGWAAPARLVRGATASLRQQDFVRLAEGFGASHPAILRHHILPHLRGLASIQLYVAIPRYILAEVTLSFLGLGVTDPYPSLGTLLADAANYQALMAYSWLLFPALALIPIILSYHELANVRNGRADSAVT